MAKKKMISLSESQRRIILLIIGSALTMLVLAFALLTIQEVLKEDRPNAHIYLMFVFFFLGLTKFLSYFKSRDKVSLARSIALLVFNIGLGITSYFAKYNVNLFAVVAAIYCVTIILSRIFLLIKHHTVRDIIYNILLMLVAAGLMLIFLSSIAEEGLVLSATMIACFVIAFSAFIEVAVISFSQLKVKTLFRIITRTFALEVLLGLLTLIIGFSIILPTYEPNIATFQDGLWYCFAVVTTIGFGDMYAVTTVGRILTVILGIYGVVVVAIITSIIVNFYNETAGKGDAKEINNIKKDIEDEKKK